uniref:R-spondin 4 n=1 Tax=Poecilia reticulata TaxID=8081 RepID=A0A3P9QGU9_POERE
MLQFLNRLFSVLCFQFLCLKMVSSLLNCFVDKSKHSHRETSEDCQSCLECSRDNGCVRCPERLFLFLQRKGMSHHGTCLHSCPNGHFGQRGRDVNRCMKCRSSDCELCFSRDFCTKCKPGFKLHKGKCLIQCPEGTFAHQTDCLEVCPLPPLGEWSEWSVCVRDGATCGFRWGKQTRVREKATEKASVCSPQRETQRCRMKKKCPTGKRERSRAAQNQFKDHKGPPGHTLDTLLYSLSSQSIGKMYLLIDV